LSHILDYCFFCNRTYSNCWNTIFW